jgi:hypothetical protein
MYTILTPEQLFSWTGQAAFYGWLILIFLPRIKAIFYIPQYIIPLAIGFLYGGLMLAHYSNSDGGFGSLTDVRTLFENDYVLLAGWVHYLAFDLFIGAWIAEKSDAIGLSRLIQAPILLATYMFGPIGLILFLSIRTLFSRKTFIQIKEKTYVSQNI